MHWIWCVYENQMQWKRSIYTYTYVHSLKLYKCIFRWENIFFIETESRCGTFAAIQFTDKRRFSRNGWLIQRFSTYTYSIAGFRLKQSFRSNEECARHRNIAEKYHFYLPSSWNAIEHQSFPYYQSLKLAVTLCESHNDLIKYFHRFYIPIICTQTPAYRLYHPH